MRRIGCTVLLVVFVGLARISAQDEGKSLDDSFTVVNTDGTEAKLTGLKFTAGAQRLTWLPEGPIALEVRETQSTTFSKGIVTYVDVSHLESLKYDYDGKVVSISLKGLKEPLKGTLQYKGLNALSFSGSQDGKVIPFSSGVPGKSKVKEVLFSGSKVIPKPRNTGTFWAVQIDQRNEKDPTLNVRNLKALYQYSRGVEQLEDRIPVRKAAELSLNDKLKRLEMVANDATANLVTAEVDTATEKEKLIVIPLSQKMDTNSKTLVGFVGEVDVGWKLFPLHTVKVIKLTDVVKKVD
jgi:hypothetical protein